MNVPISVQTIIKGNREKLSFWYNGKNKIINAPIKPYFYSDKKLDIPVASTQKQGIALSNYEPKTFYKYEFDTRNDLVKYKSDDSYEDNIPFLLRNRIDNPEIFTNYSHTNELRFLFLDIEQYTNPKDPFPTYDDRIISISWCGNDRLIKSVYLKKESTTDKKLLEKFIEEYQKIDPDVIVVYNKKYDIPTILNRCIRNRINTGCFSKNGVKPYLGGKQNMSIEGVLIYDVYLSARADQSLSGDVPNRGLKAVSNHFGFETENKEFDMKNIHKLVGTDTLIKYNKDDVKRLFLLFDIYWHNIIFNTDDLKIPLGTALDLNITDLGLIVIGDEFREHDIIADGTNYHRYPEIFQVPRKGGNYEGALVGISKTGLFELVHKADYASLYPSIMAAFNLSPDTTTLLMFEAYSKFWIEDKEHFFIYHIPDKVLNKNMVIKVSKKTGFYTKLVRRFLQERAKYKKLWKETGKKKYRAMSDNRKVKANGGIYGVQGTPNHAFGFVPIAIATCGIGRECGQLLIDILNELYPGSVIEHDTDGVYFNTDIIDENRIIELFNIRIKEKFKKELDLSIDIDDYDKGYFYKAKNYILQKDGIVIYHGAAMKARNKDLLSKELISELAVAKLNEEPTDDIVKRYSKLNFPLKNFAMNVTLGKHMRDYKNLNAIAPRLAQQAQRELGITPERGRQYYYIKTVDGYKLLDLVDKETIDRTYYLEEVQRIVKMFDVSFVVDGGIDTWI